MDDENELENQSIDIPIWKRYLLSVTEAAQFYHIGEKRLKSGMNPKMLQYIMGHSDISVTMNTYTHVKFQDAQEDFQKAINS